MEYPETPHREATPLLKYVREVMDGYGDPSHDFRHILRVLDHVERIIPLCSVESASVEARVALLAAAIHDMFDIKFIETGEDMNGRKSDITDLLAPLCGPFRPSDVLEVAESITWRGYIRNGVPRFDGPFADANSTAWKLVSMADWMDAQLVARCRDHALYVDPGISVADLKKKVKEHWDDKLARLHEHAFTERVKGEMTERMLTQKAVLERWLHEETSCYS